jgi:hypothetical protein
MLMDIKLIIGIVMALIHLVGMIDPLVVLYTPPTNRVFYNNTNYNINCDHGGFKCIKKK